MRQSLSKDKRKEYQSLVDKIKFKKISDNEFYDENENELTEFDVAEKNNQVFNYRFQRKIEHKNFSLLKALVNPIDNSSYSKLLLPRNGSMLLKKNF